ncbi:MAG: hypothetical protein K2W85_04065 [Phycisphaerales bacterium]|nr:hypothetical protein [Phycisphaerales bacterium]
MIHLAGNNKVSICKPATSEFDAFATSPSFASSVSFQVWRNISEHESRNSTAKPAVHGCKQSLIAAFLFVLMIFGWLNPLANAQPCDPQWQALDPTTAILPGLDGYVSSLTLWDPDGPGPQTVHLVVAGGGSSPSSVLARQIAAFNPGTSTWYDLGGGVSGFPTRQVFALAVLANGNLVAGGDFFRLVA